MGNSKSLSVGSQINSGQTLYTIDKLLGQGGFGITYKVTGIFKHGKIEQRGCFAMKEHFVSDFCERDNATGCVKFSAPVKDKVKESLNDFIAEARRLNSLDHPNIVAVNEVFEANDTAYYVMEYIEGKSLREYIIANGPLAEREVLTVMTPILNAVEYLHAHRMTHLDIKPDNIMLKPATEGDFTPILIDFGLSKHYDEKGRPTSTIRIQGCSAGYAPMEQYVGIDSFTPQADVYALGATMLYLLTGCQPEVASEQNSDKILSSLPAAVSDKIRQAIVRAMQPNKANRTQSVADFARDLGIELTGTAASTISASSLTQQLKKKSTPTPKRWLTPLLIILGILVVGIITFFVMNRFGGGDVIDSADSTDSTTVPSDTVADPTEQPVEVPVAPVVVDEEKDAAAELERQYRSDYSSAEQLYNQEKYSECKIRCQSMLSSYPSHRGEINALISKCDSAIAAEQEAVLEQQYQSDYTTAELLYNQKKYSECKSRCESMLNSYPAHRSEINTLISMCDNAISAAEQAAASSRLPDRAVDLGLRVLWCDCNVGASSSGGNGNYYTFDEAGSAARSMGSGWRLPTKAELDELDSKCSWSWTGSGYRVTGPNGNSIYLPAAGWREGSSAYYEGKAGRYWSSTPRGSAEAYFLTFNNRHRLVNWGYHSNGFMVRPVCNK